MESLRTADGIELVRTLAQRILQELIEAEATAHIGAAPGEHSETRTTMRNGHRGKVLTTQVSAYGLFSPGACR
ncbi:transposase [Streptomyces sp. SID2888]|uniref:transposase n=1 Tax=Streptomyces sp. SID2888 TaxID=2690256 RepID=UPI001F2D00B7|nr:transposase [Streptomyces sp. SID2888]